MIVDASAILAILFQEPEAQLFADAIAGTAEVGISAVNHVEAAVRIDNVGDELAVRSFDRFIELAQIDIMPVTAVQAQMAREAYRRFGRGNHRASLNFGDCLAYALAVDTGRALLFKGNDFIHTDVESAVTLPSPTSP
ncbi:MULTISPECIES: type II toxin-antitoxin system VapC family toxin [unclassified Minwuia]|jgi:ribonuclease VapC|uniref:type II toxin-antitoxin system VapC family toxin n=1 Tax=unclassified Minwuia TaxID=2618799 RepID=UPI00247AF330|nr:MULTISPECIES: type II toxin-antitoxin system VapC family toxin [unclassified Minwuia]